MIKEFAVDPEAVSIWERFRYVTEKFGVDQGRVISRFPKSWASEVEKVMDDTSFLSRKRLIEALNELRKGRGNVLVSFRRQYDRGHPWHVNAIREHESRPFFALVVKEGLQESNTVIAIEAAEGKDFAASREVVARRTASKLAAAVGPLIQISREIIFVDPYFRPDELRWRKPLKAFLAEAIAGGRVPKRCEFHLMKYEHLLEDFGQFKSECEKKLPEFIPRGLCLKLVRWHQIDDQGPEPGEHLHPRYILTDVGGVRVDSGLDEGEGKETTDISLLTEELWKRRRDEFTGESPVFARADNDEQGNPLAVTVTGTWKGASSNRRVTGGVK